MKDFIVLIASVVLGLLIFNMIAGGQPGSIKQTLRDVWTKETEQKSYEVY